MAEPRARGHNAGMADPQPPRSPSPPPAHGPANAARSGRRLTGPQRAVLGVLAGLLVLSVGARALAGGDPPPAVGPPPGSSNLLVPGAEVPAAEEPPPEGLESLLPYVSEGSFFGLIGFALGYASRKVVKLALIFLAVLFVVLQLLVFAEIATIDWGAAIDALNRLVLNLEENRTLSALLLNKLPTTGAFVAGIALGFRRG